LQANPSDPIEPMNRAVFSANQTIDRYVATPVAKGYQAAVPGPVRAAVKNVFANLGDVPNLVNNLLQARGVAAAETGMRLAVNSVLGIGGLIDIATPAGISRHNTDFGLTLAAWGVPSGPYLVLPLLGPSSVRDGAGMVVNLAMSPATYLDPAASFGLYGASFVDTRANLLAATDLISLVALDKYSFVRDGYLQRRRYLVNEDRATSEAVIGAGQSKEDATNPG
ncbi:MAG: VacJ family lipoprotein, partial [Dyella sp.]|nr:VacJ family lipoprotein [Dyella sp.]